MLVKYTHQYQILNLIYRWIKANFLDDILTGLPAGPGTPVFPIGPWKTSIRTIELKQNRLAIGKQQSTCNGLRFGQSLQTLT